MEATAPYGKPPAEAGAIALPSSLGRYQLLSEIATGGAAVVYLARMMGRAGFERLVAVKVLHQHLASDRQVVAMFLDEAKLAARIHHPHVVAVHDVDVIERVLGGVRDRLHDGAGSTQVVTLHNPDDGTVELTVGIADEGERRDTRGRSPSRGPS